MYSLVMLAAMTAGPDVPQDLMCPVTPSKYGCGFWSSHNFYDCCAPARYGWVNCWNKGFSYYPGEYRGFSGCGCAPTYGHFYSPSPCACACGSGVGGGSGGCSWCGLGWSIGDQPAYYTSVLGCPPHVSAPPYACYTECNPCCKNGNFAFDSGLIGHSHGVGYAGFGGYGNFGFYGGVPMQHPPTTADLPPFPRDYRTPSPLPLGPTPMPPIPMGATPPKTPELPPPPSVPLPGDIKKDEPKKDEPKKERLQGNRPAPALVVLSVPEGAVVSVEGEPLKSTGRERSFRTPNLQPGQEYSYSVKAVMIIAGREESEMMSVKVEAGETTRGSFEILFAKTDPSSSSIADAKPSR